MKTVAVTGGTFVALAMLVTGCASREVPPRFPGTAAASHDAPSAPPANVTRSLEEDDAKRGEKSPASNLPSESPATEHTGHHGHHH